MNKTLVTVGENGARFVESNRSQNKLLAPVGVEDTGLTADKNYIRIKLVTNDTRDKKVVIIPLFDGGGADTDTAFKLRDGDLYTAAAEGTYAGMKVTATSQSQISLDLFLELLKEGAIRITQGIVRCSCANDGDAEAQAIQGQGLIGVDIRGYDEDPLNLGIIKDQKLDNPKVMGYYNYPEDTILCKTQGLTYQLNAVSDKTKPVTVIMDIYWDNYVSMGTMLKNQLKRSRFNKKVQQQQA